MKMRLLLGALKIHPKIYRYQQSPDLLVNIRNTGEQIFFANTEDFKAIEMNIRAVLDR